MDKVILRKMLPHPKKDNLKRIEAIHPYLQSFDSVPEWITAAEIAEGIGIGTSHEIGCLLRTLPIQSQKRRHRGKPCNVWPAHELLQISGTAHHRDIVLNPQNAGLCSCERGSGDLSTRGSNSSLLINYPSSDRDYFKLIWPKWTGADYELSYLLTTQLLDEAERNADGCLILDYACDEKGYPQLRDPFVNRLLNPPIGYRKTVEDFPATCIPRLVAMVQHPLIEWTDRRLDNSWEGYEAHHLCRTPSCIHPDHLMPVKAKDHIALHRMPVSASVSVH